MALGTATDGRRPASALAFARGRLNPTHTRRAYAVTPRRISRTHSKPRALCRLRLGNDLVARLSARPVCAPAGRAAQQDTATTPTPAKASCFAGRQRPCTRHDATVAGRGRSAFRCSLRTRTAAIAPLMHPRPPMLPDTIHVALLGALRSPHACPSKHAPAGPSASPSGALPSHRHAVALIRSWPQWR